MHYCPLAGNPEARQSGKVVEALSPINEQEDALAAARMLVLGKRRRSGFQGVFQHLYDDKAGLGGQVVAGIVANGCDLFAKL